MMALKRERAQARRGVAARKVAGRKGLFVALGIFVVTVAFGVTVNTLVFGKGFHLNWSVSRYMGSEIWSAVIFVLGNSVVAGVVGRYLWLLGRAWKMPRVYYYCALLMVVGLITLSFFPFGLFDVNGVKSIETFIHEVSSRTMFIMMMLMAAMLAGRRATARTRAACVVFVIYAVFCVTGHVSGAEWFVPLTLIYESVYIATFPLVLASCRVRE